MQNGKEMDMTKEGARIVDKIEDNEGEIEL